MRLQIDVTNEFIQLSLFVQFFMQLSYNLCTVHGDTSGRGYRYIDGDERTQQTAPYYLAISFRLSILRRNNTEIPSPSPELGWRKRIPAKLSRLCINKVGQNSPPQVLDYLLVTTASRSSHNRQLRVFHLALDRSIMSARFLPFIGTAKRNELNEEEKMLGARKLKLKILPRV